MPDRSRLRGLTPLMLAMISPEISRVKIPVMMISVAQALMINRQSRLVNRFVPRTQDGGVKDFEIEVPAYIIRKKIPAQICTCIRRTRNVFLDRWTAGPTTPC